MSTITTPSRPELIAAAFTTLAREIDALRSADDYEPERLGQLPSLTLLFTQIGQADVDTGAYTENTWTFRVNLYLPLHDYKGAQRDLMRLLPEVLAITRRNPSLSGTCSFAVIADDGSEPVFATEEKFVRKSLRLTAESSEN